MVVTKSSQAMQKIESRLECVKHTVFCLSIITWVLGIALFGLTVFLWLQSDFDEWVKYLDMGEVYYGLYILIFAAIVAIAVGFVGMAAILLEEKAILRAHAGLQALAFVLIVIGISVTFEYHSNAESIQSVIRDSMLRLISNSQRYKEAEILRTVQESVGCCGAVGPNDYVGLLKPVPEECRDSMTGSVFPYGCVDELSFFLEKRANPTIIVAIGILFLNGMQTALSLVYVQAKEKYKL